MEKEVHARKAREAARAGHAERERRAFALRTDAAGEAKRAAIIAASDTAHAVVTLAAVSEHLRRIETIDAARVRLAEAIDASRVGGTAEPAPASKVRVPPTGIIPIGGPARSMTELAVMLAPEGRKPGHQATRKVHPPRVGERGQFHPGWSHPTRVRKVWE